MAKKQRQKSKAALETQRIREQREPSPRGPVDAPGEGLPPAEEERRGGMMMNMRSGFKAAVGQGEAETKKKKSWVDTALWILVAAAAVFFVWRRWG